MSPQRRFISINGFLFADETHTIDDHAVNHAWCSTTSIRAIVPPGGVSAVLHAIKVTHRIFAMRGLRP